MNRFYRPFDEETWGGTRRPDFRTAFQVDRDRVVYVPAFRRLQAKTQVFLPGEYDFYRTRLTHSIEVAQIGRSLCHFLRRPGGPLGEDFHLDVDLVEAVCLTHDLGHPPFGHIGERALNDLMADWGGFEGNAQTARILTAHAYERGDGDRGLQPTRALLDGILKYKALHRDFVAPDHHFLYDEQDELRRFALGPDGPAPEAFGGPQDLNRLRSLECQLMDWADDTAYSLNDIVDGTALGFLSFRELERWAGGRTLDDDEQGWLRDLFDAVRRDRLEAAFAVRIGQFVQACRLRPTPEHPLAAQTHRYAFALEVDETARREAAFYQRLAVDLIFRSPQIQQIEFKGRHILTRLFRALEDNYLGGGGRPLGILPRAAALRLERAEDERGRRRALADHLAAMTDGLALRTYKRLFDPDFRSLTELAS